LKRLFLPKYPFSGASSRYRRYQYLSFIEGAGLDASVSPFFDEACLFNKYSVDVVGLWDLFRAAIRRLRIVLTVKRGTTVFIEYELFPYFFPLVERWLVWDGFQLIIDYDDAIFHRYDNHPNSWVRDILGKKHS
jgi:hypothetical protein